MNKNILVIEDDKDISEMTFEYLEKKGYKVFQLSDGIKATHSINENNIRLVILDIMLPFKSGDEILEEIRNFTDIPVIILSAKDMIQSKVDLFKLGADDYITKPFSLVELLARIEVSLSRYHRLKGNAEYVIHKEIYLNKGMKKVTINNQEIVLTAKEFKILELMMENSSKVFSKKNLYEVVWEELYDYYDEDKLNTHISNLRKKLKKVNNVDYIQTVWGLGYKLI